MVFMNRLLLATGKKTTKSFLRCDAIILQFPYLPSMMMMLTLLGNNYDLQYRSTLQFCWINDTKYRIEHDDQLLGEMM